jgi:dTDP-4-dehydrorhamnose 3,5-epimerase
MKDKEIFIVGANGQLGQALKARYPGAKSADIDELDITDAESVANFDWSGIRVVMNAAAFTNVDGAETAEGRVAAWNVNASAVGYLVKAAIEHDMVIVHISTDYVFDGTKDNHAEDEPFSPLGVYAQTKAAADIAVSLAPKHYLLRSSWVIGNGPNFVRTMLGLGEKGIAPTVVADQVGRLTFTTEIVKIIDHLFTAQAAYGTYNATNGGEPASWADITREIFKEAGYDLDVTDTTTDEYFKGKEGIAPRPLKSTLALDKLEASGFKPKDWREDLKDYIAKEKQA